MSMNDVRAGNTRHPLYPLFLGIFGILCVIAGIVFAAEFRLPSHALAEEEAASGNVSAQAAVNLPGNFAANPFREVVRQIKPAVVNIMTERAVTADPRARPMPFMIPQPDTPFGAEPETIPSGGSGFIIDPEGHIVTNDHVITDAIRIMVTLDDGRTADAELVGTDPGTDVAVLKIKDFNGALPYLKLGDSDRAEIGDWVIAVGSPLGLEQTVTVGVVSAKNRNQVNIGGAAYRYSDFIQTDAAINFGNSGGPLLSIDGNVMGMNTAIAGGPNVSGIGFAVPANKIKFVVENLIREGVVRRGYLGIYVKEVTKNVAAANGLDIAKGALVTNVDPDTPAGRAGLEFSDLITHVDGHEVRNQQHLVNLVAEKGVGITVVVDLLRKGKKMTLRITTEQRPDDIDSAARPVIEEEEESPGTTSQSLTLDDIGLEVVTVDDTLKRRLDLPSGTTGVLVRAVKRNSEPYDEGIDEGDVITHVNSDSITDVESFKRALDKARTGDGYARLTIKRLVREDWVSLPFAIPVR